MSRFLVAAALLLLRGAAPAQGNPERVLQQAIRLHQAGDAEKAIVEYRAYLKARPDAVDARSNLGAALAQTGRYQEAAVEYREALKRRPRDPRIRLNLALAHYKLGGISEAAAELSTLHADQPEDTQTLLLLADCRLRQGLDRNVIDLLSPAAAQHPEDLAIAYLLGTALLRDNQILRSQQFIDRILRNGDSGEARLLMGTAKLDAREYEAAIAEFKKASELNPGLQEVHSYLGRAYIQTGDTAAARLAFQKELDLNPNDFESNLNLGVLLKQDQDYEGARKLLDRALLVRPGDLSTRFQRASVNLEAGRFDQARAEFEAILRQAPQFVEAHVALATTYYRMKRKADGDREKAAAQKLTAEQQVSRNKENQE